MAGPVSRSWIGIHAPIDRAELRRLARGFNPAYIVEPMDAHGRLRGLLHRALGAMVLVVGIAGCAAIFKGTRDDAFVLSNPPGAQVFVDGAYAGTTPMAVNLTADRTHSLQLRLPGYQDQAGVIQHQIGVGWVVLDVLCGVWPILIDALTGAWFHLDDVVVNLSPGGTAFLVPAYEQPPPLIPAAPDACPAGFHNIAAAGQVPVCEQ